MDKFSDYIVVGGGASGCALTNKLLRKTFKDEKNYSILEIKERNLPHTLINKTLLKSIA